MSEIICECGHNVGIHNYKCRGKADGRCYPAQCQCVLSNQAVEARYWARRMMKERNDAQNGWGIVALDYRILEQERDALQAKLDIAVEALEKLSEPHYGMTMQYNLDAQEALAKINNDA